MATLDIPNSFVPNTPAQSAQINQDFNVVASFVNTKVIHADASKPFDAIPTLPNSNPTTDNQATRKAYVDSRSGKVLRYAELTADGPNFGTTEGYAGLNSGAFTVPALLPDQFLSLEFLVTRTTMVNAGGVGFPQPDSVVEYRLKRGDGSGVFAFAQSLIPNTGPFDADAIPSVYGKVLMTPAQATNNFPGSSNLSLFGTVGGVATRGQCHIQASGGNRAFILVKIV